MDPKDLVLDATVRLFDKGELAAVDSYWASNCIEHPAIAGSGLDGLRHAATTLADGFRHQRLRALAEGDLVMVHGVYHRFDPDPLAPCDLWRTTDCSDAIPVPPRTTQRSQP